LLKGDFLDNIRDLQMVELDILKEFIKICEEHNLKYYAVAGTVLGAARHKGFIPWDDDIDVCMPREDYKKFHEIVSSRKDSPYAIQTIHTDESLPILITKFVDKSVTMLSSLDTKVQNKFYAFIDIFPMDGLPSNKIARNIRVRRALMYRNLFLLSIFDIHAEVGRKDKSLFKRLIFWLCDNFNLQRLLNGAKIATRGNKLLAKTRFPETDFCSPQLWGQYKTKAVFPTEWFGEGALLPFEDIQIIVPAIYEKYLERLYSSKYMELPPVEKRRAHSSQIIIQKKKKIEKEEFEP